jgi:hypothetical protein
MKKAHTGRTARMMALAVTIVMEAKTMKYKSQALFDTDSVAVGIDNRCTACISDKKSHFIGELKPGKKMIKGFHGEKETAVMSGTIRWSWLDGNGLKHTFDIPNSYYIPDGKCCLLSPQHWAQTYQKETGWRAWEITDGEGCTLIWEGGAKMLSTPLGERDNVATFQLAPGYDNFTLFESRAEIGEDHDNQPIITQPATVVSDEEENEEEDEYNEPTQNNKDAPLRESEGEETDDQPVNTEFDLNGEGTECVRLPDVNVIEEDVQPSNLAAELLRVHHRMGHAPFAKIQEMARQGGLPRRLRNCPVPMCTACAYGKASRKAWRGKTTKKIEVSKELQPGQIVSVDQLVSHTPGLVAQISGNLTTKRYKYATVFVDQATRLGYVHLQKTATADETIEGKKAFEKYAESNGINIRAYHADNGIFRAQKWVDCCAKAEQGLTFAGVNSHHENGIAERRIKELQDAARSMLIHANRRWKMSVNAHLWPYAVRMACDQVNNTPRMQDKERKTPMQAFSKSDVHTNLKHWHPFGSPAYVLENALQTQGIHGKWKSRARTGIYLGRSPHHSRNVGLILNRDTGLVSPQFHVKHDHCWHTVREEQQKEPDLWMIKAGFVGQQTTRAAAAAKTAADAAISTLGTAKRAIDNLLTKKGRKKARMADRAQTEGADAPGQAEIEGAAAPGAVGEEQRHGQTDGSNNEEGDIPENPNLEGASHKNPSVRQQGSDSVPTEQVREQVTRSGRVSRPASKWIHSMMVVAMTTLSYAERCNGSIEGELFCLEALFPENHMTDSDPLHVFKASTDPDTMYLHQAMKEPDREQFKEAMVKEVKDQMDNGNFIVVKRSTVPADQPIMPTVWQMKRKRDIKTRAIKKWKARLNIDGSKMIKGVHYEESYSPVATWNSIRTMLILAAQYNWHTVQIDYVLAFPQAPIERVLYMEIPKGFELEGGLDRKDHVLELHRNVYGSKNAGRTWYRYLSKKLIEEVGFTQSKVDECVFYKGSVMYILYTDDSILAGPNRAEIDAVIEAIRKAKLNITVEGDIQDFLGINIDRKEDGTIHLTQPHLIEAILKELRLDGEQTKPHTTPAKSSTILKRHLDSEDFHPSFDYRSIIGKLNYLEKGTRADISYITHQCARFATNPKVEHGEAIKWLGRYLKGTRDKGLILKPDGKSGLEIYVDADFAGNWDPADTQSRDSARSRHGYIVKYNNCPILWKSQMATEIAMSSTESEYTGASYALREAIPVMNLMKEMQQQGITIPSTTAKVHCRLYEDNSGALEILKKTKYRPRTKHLLVKLHHFRDYVTSGEISIHPIGTLDQQADYLTKPVNETTMTKLRRLVQGW